MAVAPYSRHPLGAESDGHSSPAGARAHHRGASTVQRHIRLGRDARALSPRSGHGAYAPSSRRAEPVAVLEAQGAGRVPELLPIRYSRMLASPFAFFRGGAAIMAGDLAGTPTSGITVTLCGDAHLANFGLYASPERRLVFDLNDFDEVLRGPWEWDVKRLAASLEVAGRDNGFATPERRAVVAAAVSGYRHAMRRLARLPHLDAWYEHVDVDDPSTLDGLGLDRPMHARVTRELAKARTRDSRRAADRLTAVVDGHRRIRADPPLVQPLRDLLGDSNRTDLEGRLDEVYEAYLDSLPPSHRWLLVQYRRRDVARKVVGVGSVGTRCWVLLLEGRDEDDVLLLQMKEATASALAPHLSGESHANEGRRVVLGQRSLQAVSDPFLGWHRSSGLDGRSRDFYVRQLADWKGGARVEKMRAAGMRRYGELCGGTLARAHARTGDRIAIAAYLGHGDAFDRALVRFAAAYAEQNQRDYEELERTVGTGRLGRSPAGS
jgi:uncharacterized protein (DUF2252 family)